MKYTSNFYKNEDSFERVLEEERCKRVVVSSKKCNHDSILDVGVGARSYFPYLSWKKYTILEPNKEFTKNLNGNLNIVNLKLEDSELKEKFDFIILSSILHIVDDLNIFFEKIKSLCHKDTVIHINVPNSMSIHRLLGYEMNILPSINSLSGKDKEFNHKRIFSKIELSSFLLKHQFKIISSSTYMLKPFSDSQMSKIITEDIVKGLQKLTEYYFQPFGCEIVTEAKYEMA